MLATTAAAPLDSVEFVYEPKYDGIRAIADIDPKGGARLWSRLGNEKTRQFPEIAAALARWAAKRKDPLVLDRRNHDEPCGASPTHDPRSGSHLIEVRA